MSTREYKNNPLFVGYFSWLREQDSNLQPTPYTCPLITQRGGLYHHRFSVRGASRAHLPDLLSFELYALTNAIRHSLPHRNGVPRNFMSPVLPCGIVSEPSPKHFGAWLLITHVSLVWASSNSPRSSFPNSFGKLPLTGRCSTVELSRNLLALLVEGVCVY